MNTEKYIQACLDGALRDIENAPQGMANETLNKKAFRIYQAVGCGQLEQSNVTSLLEQAANTRNIPKAEVKDTLKSAMKGIREPKPYGDDDAFFSVTSHSESKPIQQIEPEDLNKQQRSIEWYERIKCNQPEKDHHYLQKKGLIRFRQLFFTGEDRNGHFLAYRLVNEEGAICGFGRVYTNGEKRNTAGCGATGSYYSPFISTTSKKDTCYVTEGAADACSVMASTGCDAFASISSGTMVRVAEMLKSKYSEVICCLDNDNAGRSVGKKLFQVGFKCVIPTKHGQDFSDVFVAGGQNEVREQLTNEFKPPADKSSHSLPLNLDQFAITNIEELRTMLANDNWVLDKGALQGQITILFAKPNSGKTLLTLKMLIESVNAGRINGEDVYYINCDDTMRGLATKAELVAKYKIKMIASGYNGFKNEHLTALMNYLAESDEAKEKVLILDTLKKFSDLMNKTDSSAFNEVMRGFVAKGGTVIALAHTNKARDADGKVVFQGTSDTVDDADCCYTLDVVNVTEDDYLGTKATTRTVLFENFKARGDNEDKVSYEYTKIDGEGYLTLLDSIQKVDKDATAKAEKEGRIKRKLEDNEEEIELVFEALDAKINTTEKIVQFLMNEGISRARAKKVLKEHTGNKLSEGHRWSKQKGEKNQRIFKRII